MASFLGNLKNVALGVYHRLTPFGGQPQPQRPQPIIQPQQQAPPMASRTQMPAPLRVQNNFKAPTPGIGISSPQHSLFGHLIHNITHNPVTNAAGNVVVKPLTSAVVSTGKAVGQIAGLGVEDARAGIGLATGNRPAAQAAIQRGGTDLHTAVQFAQFLPRAIVQLRQSGIHILAPSNPTTGTVTPHGKLAQALLGKEPIENLQSIFHEVKKQQGTQTAIGTTGVTALFDVLAAKGGKAAVMKGAKEIHAATPDLITAAKHMTTVPLNEAGGISLGSAANRHPAVVALDQHLKDLNTARGALQARKAPQTSLDANTRAYKATLQAKSDTIKQIKQGGYAKVPGNDKAAASDTPLPKIPKDKTVAYQTAHADGEMKQVQGEPVPIVKGVDTFLHPGDGGWVVSEATTGRFLGSHKTREGAVAEAKANIKKVGNTKFKQLIQQHKLPVAGKPAPEVPVAPVAPVDNAPIDLNPPEPIAAIIDKKAAGLGIKPAPKGGVKPPTGDISTIVKVDELQKAGKPIPPALARKAGIGVAGDAPAKPAGARISDAEWQSIINNGHDLTPNGVDQVISNTSGETPHKISAERAKQQNYALADRHAYTFLEGGGKRNVAIDLYRKETGATDKMAKYKLNLIQHEINTRVTPKTPNPITKDIPEVQAGDYQKARGNTQLATSDVTVAGKITIDSIKQLSKKEKQQFADFVEHPEDMTGDVSVRLRQAVADYRDLADRVEAASKALGGDTARRQNYYHHEVDLSNPADKARYEALIKGKKNPARSPNDFMGVNQMPRIFPDIRELHKAGFHLKHEKFSNRQGVYKTDPVKQVADYIGSATSQLRKQALVKGFTEADAGQKIQNRNFDLKNGSTIPLSEKGIKEIRNFDRAAASNPVAKGYRGLNRFLKRTLLSISQFHTINIGSQAIPSLIGTPKDILMGESHPVLAAKALVGSARALFDHKYATHVFREALKDGTIDFGARVGSPVLHGSDFSTGGLMAIGKTGLGEKAVFERQIPVMQIGMLRGLRADLARRGIETDSPEARAAGLMVDKTMGFVNQELHNFDPRSQRALGDIMLAPQFTRSKWELLRYALTKGGKEGNLARRAVIGKYTADAAIILGLSYAFQQKSDNVRDMLLRALVHPSVPTPIKDKNGNTLEIGLPQNYISEAASLGITLERHANGHLGLNVNPNNLAGNLENYGRSRLAVLPAAALKLRTNTDYAGKPLYDPTAPLKVQAEQAGTTLVGGVLPIATQGAIRLKGVNQHLPAGVQEVLNAGAPGSNPLIKSAASSIGATIRSDKTVGKARESTIYFSALDEAKKGLNQHQLDAFDIYTGGKKNPVTGKYEVMPNVNDSRAKATQLLDNPVVINRLVAMNKSLSDQGQKVDPLWQQPTDKIVKVLQLQAMNPSSQDPQTNHWHNVNDVWYRPLSNERNKFFNSLPAGDPNKPPAPIKYPEPSKQVRQEMNTYFSFKVSADRGLFMKTHPELQKQFDAQDAYYGKLLPALGYGAYKGYPKPLPAVQKYIDTYTAADKPGRKSLRESNPGGYQAMIRFFDNVDLYAIDQQGGQSAIAGEPDTTSKELKAISGVAKDVYQNADGSYSLVPAGWMQGLTNGFDSSFIRKPGRVHFPLPKFGHTHLKKTSLSSGKNDGIALFNKQVKEAGLGIKPGGSNKVKIAA